MDIDELKISFILELEDLFCPEKDLVSWLPDLEKLTKDFRDMVVLTGGVSIKHYGQELLGADYWKELNYLVLVGPAFLRGKSISQFFTSISTRRGLELRMTPADDLVYLDIDLKDGGKLKRRVNLNKFFQEWELMIYRIIRLRMFLNDKNTEDYFERWRNAPRVTQRFLDIVDEDLIEYTLTADIAKVFQDPLNSKSNR